MIFKSVFEGPAKCGRTCDLLSHGSYKRSLLVSSSEEEQDSAISVTLVYLSTASFMLMLVKVLFTCIQLFVSLCVCIVCFCLGRTSGSGCSSSLLEGQAYEKHSGLSSNQLRREESCESSSQD